MLLRTFAMIVAATLAIAPAGAIAQTYPTKPIRLIVPFAAGGGGDIFARIVAERLTSQMGQQVYVDNKPGADTAIGTEIAAHAAPDGYTILQLATTQVINLSLKESVPYDLQRDFLPVARAAAFPLALVVPANSSIQSVADLVALAKATPDGIAYVSGGSGTTGHLAAELFKQATGIAALHVPYKGNSAAIPDLVAGRAQFFFATTIDTQEMVKAGKLRMLAVTTERRVPSLPNVPTMIELGFSGFNPTAWFGYVVPAKTPAAVVERLHTEIVKALSGEDVQARLATLGLTPFVAKPQDFAAFIDAETARWAAVIKAANIKVDK